MTLYLIQNAAMRTTTPPASVGLVAATTKTLLQIKPFNLAKVVEWGCSFDGSAQAVPGIVELIETDVAATVTAAVDNDVTKFSNVADAAVSSVAGLTLGVSATGFTASAEGSTTATRNLDGAQLIAPTNQFVKQFPLGREPIIQIGKFGRLRFTFPAAVNALCYMILEI